MVSVVEIEKVDVTSAGEEIHPQETSTTSPQSTMVQATLPIVVYKRKEITTSTISTLVQSTPVLGNAKEKGNDKDETNGEKKYEREENEGTQAQIGKDVAPTPTTQDQGENKNVEKANDRTRELGLTTKHEEILAIQILVTFLESATPLSQSLHRSSIEAIPLHSSKLNPIIISKLDEVTSCGNANLDVVIELPKFDLATITIE